MCFIFSVQSFLNSLLIEGISVIGILILCNFSIANQREYKVEIICKYTSNITKVSTKKYIKN